MSDDRDEAATPPNTRRGNLRRAFVTILVLIAGCDVRTPANATPQRRAADAAFDKGADSVVDGMLQRIGVENTPPKQTPPKKRKG